MPRMPSTSALVIATLAACGGRGDSARPETATGGAGSAGATDCKMLTATDVKAVTGADVRPIPRLSAVGAGGTCINFGTAEGKAYLGLSRLMSKTQYDLAVKAVPADVYPTRQPLPGAGDEAILFTGPGHIRYVVARQGDVGVEMFPLSSASSVTDEQLAQLVKRALAAGR